MPKHEDDFVYVSDGVETGRFPKRFLAMCANPDTVTVEELRRIQLREHVPSAVTVREPELTA